MSDAFINMLARAYGLVEVNIRLRSDHTRELAGGDKRQFPGPLQILLAHVRFYDQRGGGMGTSVKGDKQGLGLSKRSNKRFEA